MSGGVRSKKQEREELVRSLRSAGSSWGDIAETLRECYRINPRLAFRYAHSWSQERAAEEWNTRWPDELKTFKNFSHWEAWPGPTGHAPSHSNLGKLAELYQCSVSDLLADQPDFRHLDEANSVKPLVVKKKLILPAGRTLDPGPSGSTREDTDAWEALSPLLPAQEAAPLVRRLQQLNAAELAQVVVMWMQRFDPSVNRRALLTKLGSAFALAAVSPALKMLDPEEYEPVVRVLQEPNTFNLPALAYVERMIVSLRQQHDVIGPQPMLTTAMSHRQLAGQLAKAAPAALKSRAISAYAELSQFLGWLSVNLNDSDTAQHYLDDARSAAHDADNVELATYVLGTMIQWAWLSGKPKIGIDHAAAAAVWAEQSHSPPARAYAADVAVRAYAAADQPDQCQRYLDQEYAALKAADKDEPQAPYWYFYNEGFYWSTASKCRLKLHQPEAALQAVDQSLTLADPAHLRDRIFRMLFRAEVRIQQDEIPEASSIVSDVTRLTAVNSSPMIVKRVSEIRGLLTPWQRTKPVRELDERLAAYRPDNGKSSTNSTYSG